MKINLHYIILGCISILHLQITPSNPAITQQLNFPIRSIMLDVSPLRDTAYFSSNLIQEINQNPTDLYTIKSQLRKRDGNYQVTMAINSKRSNSDFKDFKKNVHDNEETVQIFINRKSLLSRYLKGIKTPFAIAIVDIMGNSFTLYKSFIDDIINQGDLQSQFQFKTSNTFQEDVNLLKRFTKIDQFVLNFCNDIITARSATSNLYKDINTAFKANNINAIKSTYSTNDLNYKNPTTSTTSLLLALECYCAFFQDVKNALHIVKKVFDVYVAAKDTTVLNFPNSSDFTPLTFITNKIPTLLPAGYLQYCGSGDFSNISFTDSTGTALISKSPDAATFLANFNNYVSNKNMICLLLNNPLSIHFYYQDSISKALKSISYQSSNPGSNILNVSWLPQGPMASKQKMQFTNQPDFIQFYTTA